MHISEQLAQLPKPARTGFYHWPPRDEVWEPIRSAPRGSDQPRGVVWLTYEHDRPRGTDAFALPVPFAYYDEGEDAVWVVPHDPGDGEPGLDPRPFRSNLTSVPQLVSWLVPPIGEHLRPALLHDALVVRGPDERPRSSRWGWILLALAVALLVIGVERLLWGRDALAALLALGAFGLVSAQAPPDRRIRDGRTHHGPEVGRSTADRVFRDAMGGDGTSWLRRWLMYAAVVAATRWDAPAESRADRRRGQLLVLATFGGIITLGLIATIDLFDACEHLRETRGWRSVCGHLSLPWMGTESVGRELGAGAAVAVLVPAVLSVGWSGQRRAVILGGVALAFLVHVTVAVLAVYGLYLVIEGLVEAALGRVSRRRG